MYWLLPTERYLNTSGDAQELLFHTFPALYDDAQLIVMRHGDPFGLLLGCFTSES